MGGAWWNSAGTVGRVLLGLLLRCVCHSQFVTDIELIFGNCVDYNGSDSEYAELAEESKKSFHQLVKKHFSGEEEVASKKRGRRRESRSPSACKTPELTSESSSEDSDSGR